METISKSISKTKHAIIVEECMKTGGIGASLSAIINETLFDELDHQARRACCTLARLPQELGVLCEHMHDPSAMGLTTR